MATPEPGMAGQGSQFGDHVTAAGGEGGHQPETRDGQWVADRFGGVGSPPSNEVTVDPDADEAPNVGDHD